MHLSPGLSMWMMAGEGAPLSPIEFVGSMAGNITGATGTQSIALSGLRDENGVQPTLQQNDLVIINYTNAGPQDFPYTPPAGYVEDLEAYINSSGGDTNHCIWRKFMGAVPDTNIPSFPMSGSGTQPISYTVHVFRGVDTINPLDVPIVTASGVGSFSANPAAITPVTEGALIVCCFAGGTTAAPPTYTNPGDLSNLPNHFRSARRDDTNGTAVATGFKSDWGGGAFDPTVIGGGGGGAGDTWSAVTLALRPAP